MYEEALNNKEKKKKHPLICKFCTIGAPIWFLVAVMTRWLQRSVVNVIWNITYWYVSKCDNVGSLWDWTEGSNCSELQVVMWSWAPTKKMFHIKHDWENIILLHHLTSDMTWSDLQFSEQNVSAYYSIMVVYLYVGEHHPVVNGRKHF